jgi:hypothetical protein
VTLRQVHADFAWLVVVTNAAVGLWALGAHMQERWRSPLLWRATLVAELTIFVEVILGVALVSLQDYEVAQFHAFYGFVAIAAVGIVYSYRHQLEAHLYVLYGLGGLFLMGLALRAIAISPIPTP